MESLEDTYSGLADDQEQAGAGNQIHPVEYCFRDPETRRLHTEQLTPIPAESADDGIPGVRLPDGAVSPLVKLPGNVIAFYSRNQDGHTVSLRKIDVTNNHGGLE